MNGQMMNYDKYMASLANTPEHDAVVKPYAIDYKGLVAYAKEKGVEPCNLSEAEKKQFIISSVKFA